jgi:hypothetical protein
MYKIIGADRNEYGPVGASEIEKWIGEGRANGDTKAQSEGQSEWRTLASFPEFAASLQARAQVLASIAVPVGGAPLGSAPAGPEIAGDDWQLDIGSCFSRSFALLQKHFWLVVGATAIVWALQIAMSWIPWVGPPASFLLSGVFAGGLYAFFLKLVRGQPAAIGDVFLGFEGPNIGPLMLTGLVSTLLAFVGLALCILPGIYLWVAWTFAVPLVIDKRLEFWPAMEASRRAVTMHWWVLFALILLGVLLQFLGIAACVIGWFLALPVVYGAVAYAYEDIFTRPGSTLAQVP